MEPIRRVSVRNVLPASAGGDRAGHDTIWISELMRSLGVAGRIVAPRTHPAIGIRLAGLQMLDLGVDPLAVVDDFGTVVGILTSTDLIRSLVEDSVWLAA